MYNRISKQDCNRRCIKSKYELENSLQISIDYEKVGLQKIRYLIVLFFQFRSALSMINFHFTRDDIEEIIRRYKLNDGLV